VDKTLKFAAYGQCDVRTTVTFLILVITAFCLVLNY